MKKQFLFLAFFTLALIFAGTTGTFAQMKAQPYIMIPTALPDCDFATDMTGCSATALMPVQGQPYDYTVLINAGDKVRWFVVNNNDLAPVTASNAPLLSATGGILPKGDANIDPSNGTGSYIYSSTGAVITNYNVDPIADFSTIQIAWKFFDGIADQVILVAYVERADGCTNNIAVYRIIPQPAFTIDVLSFYDNGSSPAGPTDPANTECVSPIESAVYDGEDVTPGIATTLTVDYGENWVFFLVNGRNYIDSWMPEFQLTYTGGAVPAAVVMNWAYATDATSASTTWYTLTESGSVSSTATYTGATPVIAKANAASVAANTSTVGAGAVPAAIGECIVVRVRLDWGTLIEHDQANGTLKFAANGIAYDGNNTSGTFFDNRTIFEDLRNNGTLGAGDCKPDGFVNDFVNYLITPRPRVEAGTPAQEIKTGQGVN